MAVLVSDRVGYCLPGEEPRRVRDVAMAALRMAGDLLAWLAVAATIGAAIYAALAVDGRYL